MLHVSSALIKALPRILSDISQPWLILAFSNAKTAALGVSSVEIPDLAVVEGLTCQISESIALISAQLVFSAHRGGRRGFAGSRAGPYESRRPYRGSSSYGSSRPTRGFSSRGGRGGSTITSRVSYPSSRGNGIHSRVSRGSAGPSSSSSVSSRQLEELLRLKEEEHRRRERDLELERERERIRFEKEKLERKKLELQLLAAQQRNFAAPAAPESASHRYIC